MKKLIFLLLAPALLFFPAANQRDLQIAGMSAPAGERAATNNPSAPVLPNGRLLWPRGRHVRIAAHPFGLALSSDGKTLLASCSGTEPFAISILTDLDSESPRLEEIKADRERQRGQKIRDEEDEEFRSVFMGVVAAPDNRTVFASSGNQGGVFLFDLVERKRIATISINEGKYQNSFSGAMAMTRDGKRLFVLDQANYRVAMIDAEKRAVTGSLPAGRAPFSIALSPDERKLYVTNAGAFRYSLVEGYDPKNPKLSAPSFPPYGFPSEAAKTGGTVEGIRVPGLGDPNTDEAASVWTYNIGGGEPKVAARVKTGRLLGEMANGIRVSGWSSPSGVAAGSRYIYVSNANNDSVSVLDAATDKIIATIDLNLFQEAMKKWRRQGLRISAAQGATLSRLRGQIPFGLALSRDERRLYVAEAGINAVAVIDALKMKVLGHIPTAWFPSQVALSLDGKNLYVASAKGFGAGPNGGPNFKAGPEGTYVGAIQKGVISILPIPKDRDLANDTARVLGNNGFEAHFDRRDENPVPREFGQASEQVKYIVFITKENRTHDHVFGDIPQDSTGRRLRAEPSLAIYGEKADVFDRQNHVVFTDVNVTPNHHALARQFGFSDNFYLDADVSADGHRWLVGVYPNAWVETALAASYGGHRDFRATNASPGRLTFTGSSAAMHPEDYLESGSVWEHLHLAGLSCRNYGEGLELGGIVEDPDLEPTGGRFPVNYPIPTVLLENTARDFPAYNMNISDQYRWRQFEKDFRARFIDGKQDLPRFLNIYLPNDHTARERPEDGYPYRASFVADNDLALGRTVEFLSNLPQWKQMAIFVTEDDAQDGLDSIDAHRSLLLVISPYARRGYALRAHASIAGIFKTIYLLLGTPPLNQYDAVATDLREAFTNQPDFTPYKCLAVDARLFDPKKVRMISRRKAGEEAEELDAADDFQRSHRRYAEQMRK